MPEAEIVIFPDLRVFIEPQSTPYDLRFQLFGFLIRVHPAFFLMPLLLGNGFIRMASNTGVAVVVLELVFFVSLLIHELGHSIALRFFGQGSRIVLYWLGGLAIPEDGFSSWRGGRTRALSARGQILVSLAGPLAGFLFAACLMVIVVLLGGRLRWGFDGIFPLVIPDMNETRYASNEALAIFLGAGLWSGVVWNLLNLIPVFPFDGGQVSRQLFLIGDPWDGVRKASILSLVVAIVMVLLALRSQDTFLAMMFGFLAFESYQALDQMGGGRSRW